MVMEVRLHGALWRSATPDRAAEWRTALQEVNDDNRIRMRTSAAPLDDAPPSLELVQPPDGPLLARCAPDGVRVTQTLCLESEDLRACLREYADTIQRLAHMDREAPIRGWEALDYAKRLVHDQAADALRALLDPALELDLIDARRLFTLFFLVATDLPESLVRYHRFHR
jgi:uncharacterized protein (UPF0262 family)